MIVQQFEKALNCVGRNPLVHRVTNGKLSGPVHRALSRFYPEYIIIEPKPGVKLKFKTDEHDSLGVKLREYEPDIRNLVRAILTKNDIAVDVGAHTGFHALLMSLYAKYVIAIEPNDANFRSLIDNINLNKISNIEVLHYAAGNEFRVNVPLYISDKNSGMHSLRTAVGKETQTTATIRLEDFLGGTRTIKLIKIDVEGWEPYVVQGLGDRIQDVHYIIFESHETPGEATGYNIFDQLDCNGFKIEQINDTNYLATNSRFEEFQKR